MFELFFDTRKRSLVARFISIKQDGSYNDYVNKFVNYFAHIPNMAESVFMDAFMTRLELELQVEVVSIYPQNVGSL